MAEVAKRGLVVKTLDFNPQDGKKQWDAAKLDFADASPPKRCVPVRVFLERMTPAEWDDLCRLAQTNDAARGFLERMRLVGQINADDPAIQTRLTAMLGAVRAAELLAP
jgi:hypothetical protein